jgi:prepilin-type N-terminal cleavage/methylation domain-containing protein
MSMSARRQTTEHGFSLLEVLVAVGILAVGMVSTAALLARMTSDTVRSKYMSIAAMLASEKLEDLNRWPANDPHVAVTSGTTAGSLTSDVVQNVTVGATTTDVNYYDEVGIAASNGAMAETVSGLDGSGNVVSTTTIHTPDGYIGPADSDHPAPPFTYKRRWLIEKDPVVNGVAVSGVRRVTVLVTLEDATVRPGVTLQMSAVRP